MCAVFSFFGLGAACTHQFVANEYQASNNGKGVDVIRLNRWGNSLGVRLPKHFAKTCGLISGDYVFLRLDDATGDLVMRPAKARDVDARYFANNETKTQKAAEANGSKAIGGCFPTKAPVW